MVKDLVVSNDSSQIKHVICALEHDFTLSSNPNSRKGGLVGLAAASIALGRVSFTIIIMIKRQTIEIIRWIPEEKDLGWGLVWHTNAEIGVLKFGPGRLFK